jgi:D-alanyl-D-alanine carboxypeptidase
MPLRGRTLLLSLKEREKTVVTVVVGGRVDKTSERLNQAENLRSALSKTATAGTQNAEIGPPTLNSIRRFPISPQTAPACREKP